MSAASEQLTQGGQQNQQTQQTQVEQTPDKKKDLRGKGFDEQTAQLAPAGEQTTTPKPGAQKQAEQQQPQKPQKTRAQILKENASKMSEIEDLLSYGAFDWAITDKEATRALYLLACMPDGEAPVVVQGLMAKAPVLMQRLHENAPSGARQAYPLSYLTVVAVSGQTAAIEAMLKTNPSAYGVGTKHAGRAELGLVMSKASTGFIKQMASWSVSTKPEVAAPFQTWLSYTPEPQLSGITQMFRQAGDDQKTAWKAESDRKADQKRVMDKYDKADNADAKALRASASSIEELLSYSFTDWAITDGEARKVFGMLAAIPSGDAIRYVVMKLDQGPFVDRFISNLPAPDRWNNKRVFLNILAARAPEKNVAYVKELLSYGIFDWAVTDEDARLAFALVKTMPKDVRDQFKNADGGKWWGRMEGNLDQADKTAKDAHFYDNKEEVQKKKLEFEESAQKWPKGQLNMAIEMLVRMGEEDWVEKQCQAKFDKSEEHAWIFKEKGFAHAGGQRDPAIWKEFKEKSAGQKFAETMKGIGSGIKLAGQVLGAAGDMIDGKGTLNVDLQDVQNVMGGDVAGVKFAKTGDKAENKIGIGADLKAGKVSVSAPVLNIASIAVLQDTTRISSGPVTVSGISVEAKWPTEQDPSSYFKLSIAGIDAKEIWQISETSMIGIGGINVAGLTISAKTPRGAKPSDGASILAATMTDIQESMTRLMSMIDTKDPQPEKIGQRVGTGFMGGAEVDVELGALTISDVTQSAGGHVGQVKAEGLSLKMSHQKKGDLCRARLAELEAKEKKGEKLTTEEAAEKAEAQTSLPKIAALEKREAELVAQKEKSETKELSPGEQEELASIRDQLTVTTADVGLKSLSVKDVDTAGIKAKSLELNDMKVKVQGERELGEANGVLDMNGTQDKAKLDEKKKGAKPDSKVKVEMSVGSLKGTGIVMAGKNKLESYEARIAEIKAKLDAREATEEERQLKNQLEAEIDPVHKNIVRRDEIKLLPPAEKAKYDAELRDLSGKLEPWVGRAPDTSIDELSMTGKDGEPALKGKVDVASGKLSIQTGDVEVKGVKSGDMQIGSAKVSGMSAQVDAGANLLGGADLTKTLTSASAHVDHAEIADLKMGGDPLSKKLNTELEALTLKAKLNADKMTEDEKKRLAELPALYTEAATNENRLATLRDLQKNKPAEFTPEMEQELKMLADKCDPKVTTVKKAEMNNLDLKLDTKAGKIEVGAGKEAKDGKDGAPAMKVEGVEIGQLKPDGTVETKTKVDSAKMSTVKGQLKTEGGMGSLLDPMSAKEVGAGMSMTGVEVAGLEQKGQTFSATLQGEADALATKAKGKTPLEEKDKKRLAELPALIKQAKADEARLIELRRIQKTTPDKFNSDMDFELKSLAKRLDPSSMKVAKAQVSNVDLNLDTKAGKLEVGVGKEGSGQAGVKVEGVELGKVQPDGTVKTDTKVQSAQLESFSAKVETDKNTAAMFDPTKSQSLKANMKATGIDVKGVEQGTKGESGYTKIDQASIGSISADYDKADGGKASLDVQNAKLVGFVQQSSRLATLKDTLGALHAKPKPLEKADQEALDKAEADLAEYEKIAKEAQTAKGEKKKKAEKKLADWEAVKDTMKVGKADVGHLKVGVTGVGDLTSGQTPDMKKVGFNASLDKASVEDVKAGDLSLKKASIDTLNASGSNIGDEDKRKAHVDVKGATMEGFRQPGTAVNKANIKGINADLNGRSLDASVKQVNANGVASGSSTVNYASASGISVAMRDMGTDKERMNANVAYLSAGGISTGTKDNLTTIDKVKGSGLSVASGKGYKGSKGPGMTLASVDAQGITNTSFDKATGSTSVAKVNGAQAQGISMAGGNVKVKNADVNGVSYNTKSADGASTSSIGLESANVKGVGLNTDPKGKMTVNVDEASGKGLTYSDTKPVEKDGQTLNELTTTKASVGDFNAKGIGVTKDGTKIGANVGSVEANNIGYSNTVTTGDGKTVLDKSSAHVDKAGVNGITADVDTKTGGFGANVKGANVKGVKYDDEKRDGSTTSAKVDGVDIKGISAAGNYKDGVYGVGAENIGVDGVHYKGTKADGSSNEADVKKINLGNVQGYANTTQGQYGGMVGNADISGISYNATDDKGVKTTATVDSVKGKELYGTADTKNGEYGGGFKQVTATGVDYQTGEKGKDGYMKVQTDKAQVGNGQDFSTVMYKKDGTLDANIKAIELGPNTKGGVVGNVFEMTKKDEKTQKDVTTTFKLGDEAGNAGKFTVGEVRMKDFNPADMSDKKSQLQVFDIGADKFVLDTGSNVVVGNGAKLDSIFMKGQGDGKTQAGYSGLKIDGLDVDNKAEDGTRSDFISAKDINSSGGYAVMTGFKKGDKFNVDYAKVKDLTAGEIKVEYKIPPPTYDGDKAKYDKEMEAWKNRGQYDPKKGALDLSGLGQMDGHVNAKYTYNRDDGGFWDGVGAAITGRSASADLDIKNGGIDGRTADIGTDGVSLLGTGLGTPILNSFQYGFNGAAYADDAITGNGGLISIPGLGAKYGSQSEKDFNKEPEAPDKSKYDEKTGILKKDDGQGSLDRIDVDANLTNMGGGNIGYGTTFNGQMNKGGSAQIKGNVGKELDVNAQNLGFTNVQAMDGEVQIGSVGTKDAKVKVTNLADPEKGQVNVTVTGTTITDVQYGGKGVDKKGADDDFEKMTKK